MIHFVGNRLLEPRPEESPNVLLEDYGTISRGDLINHPLAIQHDQPRLWEASPEAILNEP
jgi:hypothetical protein